MSLAYCLVFLLSSLFALGSRLEDDFSDEEENTVFIVGSVFSVLSLCGSSFIVMMFVRHPKLRSFMFRLVVWISICDIVVAVSYLIGNPKDGTPGCYSQAIMQQVFQIASALWTASIAATIDAVYLRQKSVSETERMFKWMHAIVWPMSVLLAIPPAASQNYGETTGWCWITVSRHAELGQIWRFLCFYVPIWIIAAYNLSVFWRFRKSLVQATGDSTDTTETVKRLRQMVYYPLVFVACYFWGTINRIQSTFSKPIYAIVMLHVIGMSSQGTLNAIVYGLTPAVRKVFWDAITFKEMKDELNVNKGDLEDEKS